MRIGVAHHFGWAVAVTADANHAVVDRRRIELIGPGVVAAPVHHRGGAHVLHGSDDPPPDDALAALVAEVRVSAVRATADALEDLARDVQGPITSLSVRAWPPDFPTTIAEQRRVPYESRADSVMYCQVLADAARARGWEVAFFDAGRVEKAATLLLGGRAEAVLHGPRVALGPPWTKDHRIALAATVVASHP